MYCHNCGQQLPDTALFCPECGTKVAEKVENPETPVPSTPVAPVPAAPTAPVPESGPEVAPPQAAGAPGSPKPAKEAKKKAKIGILTALAVVVVAVALFVAFNWRSVNYVASVQAFQPFYHSQGLPYSYGEVLDAYLPDAEWSAVKEGKGQATVEVRGTAKGLDEEITLSMKMAPDPENPNGSLYTPESASLGEETFSGTEETVEFLYQLFVAYDQQVEDLSLVLPGDNVELTQTFTDEEAGITFSYPESWEALDTESEYQIASLMDSQNTEDSVATMTISVALDTDPFGIRTGDEASVKQAVNELHQFVSLEDTTLGDVPAIQLVYDTAGLKGTDRVINYWYERGDETYQVVCSYSELAALKYEPIFEDILESYQVAPMPEPTPTPTPAPTPTPEPMQDSTTLAMEAYLGIIGQASSYDFSGGYGDPNPPDAVYSYALAPMCPDQQAPALLLSCGNVALGSNYIRVFQYDEASGTMWQPADIITTGIREGISYMADGEGLYHSYANGMSGDAYVDRITVENGELRTISEWAGMIGDSTSPTYLQGAPITWYDTQDASGLVF